MENIQLIDNAEKDSIELRKLTMGQWGWTIKLRFDREKEKADQILAEIARINEELKKKYGDSNGFGKKLS